MAAWGQPVTDPLACAHRLVVAAWGQPVTLGFSSVYHTVLYSSETQNVMLPLLKEDKPPLREHKNGWRDGLCTDR